MFRALNESSNSENENEGDTELATKEAQEEEAYSMYNTALKSHYQGNLDESQEMFEKILALEFISQVQPQDELEAKKGKDEKVPLCPALNLKYLVLKNLATISCKKKNYEYAVSCYLKALDIDATDVNTWYRTGITAKNLPNYSLSRLCFEEGLKCNPNHWPSLDHVITVTYALNDYANCLYHISRALELESCYLKGLALKDKIYKEDPSLKMFCEGYFDKCDPSIHYATYDKDEAKKIIEESLNLREKNRSLYKPVVLQELKLNTTIKEMTWKAVGESFVDMYEYITTADPFISLSCKIDLSGYLSPNEKESTEPEPMSVSIPGPTSEATSSSNGKQSKIGLLQMVSQESSVEKEDDSPNVSGMSLISNSFLENGTGSENELRPADPLMYIKSDAPLGNKKTTRRKRSLLSELSEFCGKRRSTRVRNPAMKRPQDSINYQEILQQFLPSRLVGDGNYDDQDSDCFTLGKNYGDHTYGQIAHGLNHEGAKDGMKDVNNLASFEKKDIEDFLLCHQRNGGIIDLMFKYVTKLGAKSNFVWPKSLPDVFSCAFIRLRKHITMPNLFCLHENDRSYAKEIGFAVLTFSELKVDQWYLGTGHSASLSMSFSPKMPPHQSTNASFQIGPDFIGKNFHADMEFLMQLAVCKNILEEDWLQFTLRALWLKAKFHSVEGEVDMAVSCMERLKDVLQADCQPDLKVVVLNSCFSNVITLETVNQQLELLQRCQSLEEIQRLYESGAYQSVVDLLIPTFSPTHSKPKITSEGGVPERHAQLMLLQDSLWKMGNYRDCVKWTEVAFKESIQQYMNATPSSLKNDWIDTMSHLLCGLERCAKANQSVLNELDQPKLIRLTQNLILVICLQMESYEISMDSSLSVLPWLILYHLICGEEYLLKAAAADFKDADKDPKAKGSGDAEPDSSTMPASLLLLITAHECLGRRSCCCAANGMFLLHCVDVFMKQIHEYSNKSPSYREDLEMAIEQAFYCLYGHPHKRNKAKHLQEHGSQQLSITWERCFQIYQYFTPSILPEFDSYKTSTVSAELENLLRRIAAVIPPELDPASRVDAYNAYIEGGTDKCPIFSAESYQPNIVTRDLYYLLGDYYFKNKEFSKAIRYYLLDVCINPDRLDSWAGMALSRSSQLDQKLNSYEVRNESAIWRKSSAALRCFEHALKLNASTNSLWIEYGSLAYVLHSHASRQLKLNTYFDGPRDLLKVKKEEMLLLAERCFREANKSVGDAEPEEAWLHHYMLGKISQKFNKPPSLVLDHYQKSLQYLHEDHARYPHKIQYHNPPNLSIEVLEVFYRIHASCLKYLCKCESTGMPLKDVKVFHDCLANVAVSPFATFQEKVYEDWCEDLPAAEECEELEEKQHKDPVIESSVEHSDSDIIPQETKKPDDILQEKSIKREIIQEEKQIAVEIMEEIVNTVVHTLSARTSNANMESSVKNEVADIIDQQDKEMADDRMEVSHCITAENEVAMEVDADPSAPVEIVITEAHNSKLVTADIPLSDGSSHFSQASDPSLSQMVTVKSQAVTETYVAGGQDVFNPTLTAKPTKEESMEMDDIVEVLNEIITTAISAVENADLTKAPTLMEEVTVNDNFVSEVARKVINDSLKILSSPNIKKLAESSEVYKELPVEPLCSSIKQEEKSGVTLPKHSGDNLLEEKQEGSNQVPTDLELQIKKEPKEEVVDESELQQSKREINSLISDCLNGLRECLKRFIQHYKSLYRIAEYYYNSSKNKNLQWSREVLLAATPAVKNYPSMPGLFAERKNTNLFNGIWRAPSNEIDRPGSFGAHMYRSVYLLIGVLTKQNDYNMLLYLTQQLHRNPDLGKKYMRDVERISLARRAYDSCVTILREQMNSLLQEEPPPEESRLTCCLLEIFRTFQTLLKGGIYVDDTNELLEEAYTMYKLGEVDQYPAVLEQAVRFCQLQLGKSYQVGQEPLRCSSSSKQTSVITEIVSEGSSKISNPLSVYTPDAWQRGKR